MPLLGEILKHRIISISGMEKNTGKTECLNYILQRYPLENEKLLVTSVGVDGESSDIVHGTHKPEITIRGGIFFATGEKYIINKKIVSEIVDIDYRNTPSGRIITSIAKSHGKAILAGYSDTTYLKKWIKNQTSKFDINRVLIDGALSRLTPASPAICDALILTTGAALSLDIKTLVERTMHTIKLINLGKCEKDFKEKVENIKDGVWIIEDKDISLIDGLSSFSPGTLNRDDILNAKGLFFGGVFHDRMIDLFKTSPLKFPKKIVVRDYTKIFIQPSNLGWYINNGGVIEVLESTSLIALCVNPTSPNGYKLNSDELCSLFAERCGVPVYDIFKLRNEA